MCRLLAYKGTPILLDDLLYKPKNSLVNQSLHAREIEEPLNGDGFGLGWYVPELNYEPITFVSVNPAWSNRNLRNLAPKMRTECMIAHVRAASVGEVSEANRKQLDTPNVNMLPHFRRVVRTSSATFKSEASLDNRAKNKGFQHLAPKDNDRFAIARKDNLTKAEAFKKLTFSSFAEANDMIQRLPISQRKELQVVESQEFV